MHNSVAVSVVAQTMRLLRTAHATSHKTNSERGACRGEESSPGDNIIFRVPRCHVRDRTAGSALVNPSETESHSTYLINDMLASMSSDSRCHFLVSIHILIYVTASTSIRWIMDGRGLLTTPSCHMPKTQTHPNKLLTKPSPYNDFFLSK